MVVRSLFGVTQVDGDFSSWHGVESRGVAARFFFLALSEAPQRRGCSFLGSQGHGADA